MRDWQQHGRRPAGVDFSPSVEIIERELREVLAEFSTCTGSSVLITSNGRLRELGRIVGGLSAASAKVSTGGICVLQWDNGVWRVLAWNSRPEDLLEHLKGTGKVDKLVK